MATTNKSSLQNILTSVLSVANSEANQTYPPSVFQSHYNIVTSFILDALSDIYPSKLDILLPFIKALVLPVTNGYIQLPPDYRNLLGAPSITAAPDGSDCGEVIIDTPNEFKTANLKAGCKTYPIEILSKGEWDSRTTSTYAYPTYKNPIGLFVADRRLKVCPYDLARVEVTYVKNEVPGLYTYYIQPDDTYINDPLTTVEVGWTDAGAAALFKGCLALYGAYVSNPNLTDFVRILQNEKLF